MKKKLPSNKYAVLACLFVAFIAGCSDGNQQGSGVEQQAAPDPQIVQTVSQIPVAEAQLVLSGGLLLSMVGDEPGLTPVKGVVIRDGRIERIIEADSSEALPSAERSIDASSYYILPGLIDSHTHFRPWTPTATIWRRGALHYGVTGLVDFSPCGANCRVTDPNQWILAYKDLLNNSPISVGPTLYVTGMKLHAPDDDPEAHAHNLQSLDEVAAYIDYLAGLGVDALTPGEEIPVEYRQKIVVEAQKHGLPVLGGSRNARESISVGHRFIEHMHPVTNALATGIGEQQLLSSPDYDHLMDLNKAPELIEMMVKNRVYLNPTMVSRYVVLSDRAESFGQEAQGLFEFGEIFSDFPLENRSRIVNGYRLNPNLDPVSLQNQREGFSKIQTFLQQFSEAGGMIVVGPDTTDGRLPGLTVHQEMQMLVDAGVAPYKVLLGATRWAAEMLKDDMVGTIEEAKQADILLLASNPLDDISNTRDIRYVIRKGNIVRSSENCSVIEPPIKQTCR